jgi:hypothetical protein
MHNRAAHSAIYTAGSVVGLVVPALGAAVIMQAIKEVGCSAVPPQSQLAAGRPEIEGAK